MSSIYTARKVCPCAIDYYCGDISSQPCSPAFLTSALFLLFRVLPLMSTSYQPLQAKSLSVHSKMALTQRSTRLAPDLCDLCKCIISYSLELLSVHRTHIFYPEKIPQWDEQRPLVAETCPLCRDILSLIRSDRSYYASQALQANMNQLDEELIQKICTTDAVCRRQAE